MLLGGQLPFNSHDDDGEIVKQILEDKPDFTSKAWLKVSPPAKEVCCGLLKKDPTRRFDLEVISKMEWFSDKKRRRIPSLPRPSASSKTA